jgi:hypothetical protein
MSARAQPSAGIAFRVASARRQARMPGSRIQQWTLPNGTPWATFHRTASGYAIRFPGLADFSVSVTGERVECRPVPGVSNATIEHIYLNQVVPLALSRSGRFVFHASAVDLGGHGAAFMGASGRGKSTLAASFAACGCRFLADDGLILMERAGRPWIAPNAPSVRLWEDSRAAVLAGTDVSAAAAPRSAKVRYFAGKGLPHRARPLPLKNVYFLGAGRTRSVSIEPLPKGEALIELVRYSFLIDVQAEELLAAHFSALAAIAPRCAFFRLDYPRRFALLPAVRAAILEHAA